jgi:lipoprotein NlpD
MGTTTVPSGITTLLVAWLLPPLFLLYGCASTSNPAPVSDYSPQATRPSGRVTPEPPETRPDYYIVKKGDTLFSIALDNGLDYKELAAWNGINDPHALNVGQQLRLKPSAETAVTARFRSAPAVAGQPVGPTEMVKSQPQAIKAPYSDQAFARLSPQPSMEPPPSDNDENIQWGWPTNGKIVASFNEANNAKGIDIAGNAGQPVLASAAGTVLYSGSGIRGYGKLIVLKHNKIYSSVYAHNNLILVKEGQTVVKGQKIAEMGNTDADQIELHFEIRQLGKPIDPAKLLLSPN